MSRMEGVFASYAEKEEAHERLVTTHSINVEAFYCQQVGIMVVGGVVVVWGETYRVLALISHDDDHYRIVSLTPGSTITTTADANIVFPYPPPLLLLLLLRLRLLLPVQEAF